jgi:pimeloyl-ACP methyl ester carboxylesterase
VASSLCLFDRSVKSDEDGPMPFARGDGVELWYEVVGDADGVPLLLINGLGSQMVSWPPDLLAAFGDRGFKVICFDNRDTGLSTKFDDGEPVLPRIFAAFKGEPVDIPYFLRDMAGDAVTVLDAVGERSAHVVGQSMGGMIAQQLAIDHPQQVRSLTSIMSTTGDPDAGQSQPGVVKVLYEPAPTEREANVEHAVEVSRTIGSPSDFDEAWARRKAQLQFDRGLSPQGTGRQMLAVGASGSRSEALSNLDVPALVIHGDVDPLIDVSGGRRTAEVISGAELLVLAGMGHDLPPSQWPSIVEAITRLAAAAPDPAGAA